MALTQELESDIRRAINPIYADRIGTESHERSALLGEIDRLRGEVDALRKDAARYRWIRENGDGDRWEIVFDECGRGLLQAEALDAAIDAAMKSEQSRLIGEAKE